MSRIRINICVKRSKQLKDRHHLLGLLAEYADLWPHESVSTTMVDFIQQQPACFERNCFDDGHVTGSAWIVCPRWHRVLLTHHRKLGKWLQLGGHSDSDAATSRVAQREAEEESGLSVRLLVDRIFDLDIHTIPAHGVEPMHKHYDIRFLFEADDAKPLVVSHESKDLRWVNLAEVGALTQEQSIQRMVTKSFALRPQ